MSTTPRSQHRRQSMLVEGGRANGILLLKTFRDKKVDKRTLRRPSARGESVLCVVDMSANKTPKKRINMEKLDRYALDNVALDLDEDLHVNLHSQDENDDDTTFHYLDIPWIMCSKRDLGKSHLSQEGIHTWGYEDCETTKKVWGHPSVKSEMEHSSSLWKETSCYSMNASSSNPCTQVGITANVQVTVPVNEKVTGSDAVSCHFPNIAGNTILNIKSNKLDEESDKGMDTEMDLRENKIPGYKLNRDVITVAHRFSCKKQAQQVFRPKNYLSENSVTARKSKSIPSQSETSSLISQGIDGDDHQMKESTDVIEMFRNDQHQMKDGHCEREVGKNSWYQMKESLFNVTEILKNDKCQTGVTFPSVSDRLKMDQYKTKKENSNLGQIWKNDLHQVEENRSDTKNAWKSEPHQMKERSNMSKIWKDYKYQIMENSGKSEAWKNSQSPTQLCLTSKKMKDDYLKKMFKRPKSLSQGSLPINKDSTPSACSVWPAWTGPNLNSFSCDEGELGTANNGKLTPEEVTLGVENFSSSASPSKVKSKYETQRSNYPFIAGSFSQSRPKDSHDKSTNSYNNSSFKNGLRLGGSWRERKSVINCGRSSNWRRSLPNSITYSDRPPALGKETGGSLQAYSQSTDEQNANYGILEPSGLHSEMSEISIQMKENSNISNEPEYDVRELQTKHYDPGFIDTHCHLDFLFQRISHSGSYRKFQLGSVDTDPFPVSYEGCVAIFCKPWTFRRISWWEEMITEANVWAAFGCHPHFSDSFGEEEEGYLRHALQNSKTVALGEIGLDYSGKNSENHEVQQTVFRRQLKIAVEFKKPLVIHCRNAHWDCIEILKEIIPRDYLIHRHCFTETWDEAKEWMETFSRLYLGFTNLVTCPNSRRSWNIQEVVRRIPLDRLLLETDAPYFRPHCYSDSGQFSHPGMAIHVAAQVAVLRNEEVQVVLKQARQNTRDMYGI